MVINFYSNNSRYATLIIDKKSNEAFQRALHAADECFAAGGVAEVCGVIGKAADRTEFAALWLKG